MDNQQDLAGLYICDICGQNGLNDMEMKMHMATTHGDDVVCLFCDLKGITPDEMTLHINSVHFNDNLFMSENRNMELEQNCDGCTLMKKNDYVFSDTKDALSFHKEGEMKMLIDELNIEVAGIEESVDSGVSSNKCSCSCKEEAAMSKAKDTKFGVVTNTSSLLSFTENTMQLINPNVHAQSLLENQSTSSPETEMESNFLCPFCDFVTDDGNAIERHFAVDHSDIFLAGKANNESFASDYNHRKTPLFCPICGLIFQECSLLQFHVNGHFREDLQTSKSWFRCCYVASAFLQLHPSFNTKSNSSM